MIAVLRTWLLSMALAFLASGALAQEPAGAPDLRANDDNTGFTHEPSKSQFTPPKGWEVVKPFMIGKTSFLALRQGAKNQGDPTVDVLLSWSPLTVREQKADDGTVSVELEPKWTEVVSQEVKLMQLLYNADKIDKPEDTTVNGTPGVRLVVDNGPALNDKESGLLYLFETGADPTDRKNRWKVKVRANVPKQSKAAGLKAVDELVKNLKW